MRGLRPFILAWLVIGMLRLPATGDTPSDTSQDNKAAPAFAVFLANPNDADGEPPYLNDKNFHFHAVIQNVSAVPQKIWSDLCSWGYGITFLEVTAIDGKPPPKPLYISQGGRAWSANFPMALTLQPGEMLVRDMHLNVPRPDPTKSGVEAFSIPWGPDYFNFPLPTHGDTETVSVRTLFSINEGTDARKLGVWSGHVASPVQTFTVVYRASQPMF